MLTSLLYGKKPYNRPSHFPLHKIWFISLQNMKAIDRHIVPHSHKGNLFVSCMLVFYINEQILYIIYIPPVNYA